MEILNDYPLLTKNTFGINCTAKNYADIRTINDLKNFTGPENEKFLVLGGGSNVVLPDYFDGTVLDINITGIEFIEDKDDSVIVRAGGGENWHQFVEGLIDSGIYGFENLALIPGKAGAAPIQNIGAYGIEQEKYFFNAEVYNLSDGSIYNLSKEECKFGYRNSVFKENLKKDFVITHVTYKFPRKWQPILNYKDIQDLISKQSDFELTPKNIFKIICEIRRNKLPDPEITGNAGSFFKNPVVSLEFYEKLKNEFPDIKSFDDVNGRKLSAAQLIEKAGWKGKKMSENSQVSVSPKHSLVLINLGNAIARDIVELSSEIIEDIFSKFGIRLEREVNIIV